MQTRDAEALPGVTVVHDGDFVGVAAPTEQAADRALAAIQAEWKTTPQPSSDELFSYLKDHPATAAAASAAAAAAIRARWRTGCRRPTSG